MKTVDILQSQSEPERYYVGLTNALDIREAEHNAGLGYHTSRYKPWQVKVAIQFRDWDKAFLFERYLKSGSGREFVKRHW